MGMLCSYFSALLLLGLGISFSAKAEGVDQQASSLRAPRAELVEAKPKPAKIRTQLQINSTGYSSQNTKFFRNDAEPLVTSLEAGLRFEKSFGRIQNTARISNQYNAEERANYFKPYEFYAEINLSDSQKTLGLGRKILNWSETDRVWGRGLWQPRFFHDKIRSEEAGLTGFYFSSKQKTSDFTLFLMPIFIPDLGPTFDVEDGKIKSPNPWFRPPPPTVGVIGTSRDIRYSVDQPSLGEVMNNPGIAAQYGIRRGEDRYRISMAHKPMNQLFLGFPYFADLSSPDVPVDIRIHPEFPYHNILELESEHKLEEQVELVTSLVLDNPTSYPAQSGWVTQDIEDALLLSTLLKFRNEILNRSVDFQLGLINLWGGDLPDRGELNLDHTLFERRFQFQQAMLVGAKFPLAWIQGTPVYAKTRLIYDAKQEGGVFSGDLSYRFARRWEGNLGFDFLGLLRSSGQEVSDGLLSLYRANDRISGGVSYVF